MLFGPGFWDTLRLDIIYILQLLACQGTSKPICFVAQKSRIRKRRRRRRGGGEEGAGEGGEGEEEMKEEEKKLEEEEDEKEEEEELAKSPTLHCPT